jgi:hypothetical protein
MWITAEGTIPARLELESDEGWTDWASAALKGAAAGALTGAAGGPYGMLAGAAVGAGLGVASAAAAPTTSTPTPSGPAPSAPRPSAPATGSAPTPQAAGGSSNRTAAITALQQFAAAVPILVQLVASSGGKESTFGDDGLSSESLQEGDWGPESFQGTWTLP